MAKIKSYLLKERIVMNELSLAGRRRSGKTVLNLICSLLEHGVSACLALVITPLLVRKLGIELYGLYPIVLEISALLGIAFGIVNSTSGRYIAIEEEQGNTDNASKYFSSVFIANVIIGAVMLLPMVAVVRSADVFLEIPADSLTDARTFMCLVFASVLVDALASAFGSVYYVTNRLDIRSGQQLAAAVTKALVLGLFFGVFEASLTSVGAAIFASAAVSAVIQIFVFGKLASGIKLSFSCFSLGMTKRLAASGFWYSVNRLASVMMCGGLLVLTNAFFLPSVSGQYSLAFVAVNALGGVIMVLAAVFVPVSAKHFARGEQNRLRDSLARDQKIVGFFAAVAVSVFISFCDEFYRLWLGDEPDRLLLSLSVMLVTPVLSLACATPIINVGMVINRTRKLSLFFLCGGLLSLAAALGVIFYTDVGIYGVALTSCLSQVIWYSVAVPFFAARVLRCSPKIFLKPVLRTFFAAAAALAFCLALGAVCQIKMWVELFIVAGAAAVISAVIAFFCVFKSFRIRM